MIVRKFGTAISAEQTALELVAAVHSCTHLHVLVGNLLFEGFEACGTFHDGH